MLALTRPYNVLEDIHHYCEKVSNNPISLPIKIVCILKVCKSMLVSQADYFTISSNS